MLDAVPEHWFSWDFAIRDATRQPVAKVRLSSWRERGAVIVNGIEHKVSRQGVLRGAFVLERGGSVLARAEKPSAFRREFRIEHGGKQYTLKGRSIWRRERVLYDGGREIGAIIPEGLFSRRARAELPDTLPLLLRLFVVWLTMLLWKREADAAA
jgi:hypothetical protein